MKGESALRKPIIAGNWKMNKTYQEAKHFVAEVKGQVPDAEKMESVICAPALFLEQLVNETAGYDLGIGAQTMHEEEAGAFTGEISPVQLRDIGVQYVIIGHSERRQYFNETDEAVNRKAKAALAHDLVPIMCVGETLEQRENGETNRVVEQQVAAGLEGLSGEDIGRTVIAYEPIWAIGTGKTATADDANTVCGVIRKKVSAIAGNEAADAVRIQYGGSVKPANADELLGKEHIDGALVGGASLESASFLKLLEAGSHE